MTATTKERRGRAGSRPIPAVIATAELFELNVEEGDPGWERGMRNLIRKYQHQIAEELSGRRRPDALVMEVYAGKSKFWDLYREVVQEN